MPKGWKAGGRKKGTPNKKTVERAAALQIDNARRGELPVDVLARLMKVAEGTTAKYRAMLDQEGGNTKENKSLFGEWFDRTRQCARDLAPFTAPTYRAVSVVVTPSDHPAVPASPLIEHEPRDEGERERRASDSYLKLVKG